jgi:hypothetical protein
MKHGLTGVLLAFCMGCAGHTPCVLQEYLVPQGITELYWDLGDTNQLYEYAHLDSQPMVVVKVLHDASPNDRFVHFLRSTGFEFPENAWVRFDTNTQHMLIFTCPHDHYELQENFWRSLESGKLGWLIPVEGSNTILHGSTESRSSASSSAP